MWPGYLSLDGVEILNSSRVEAYARTSPWFRPAWGNKALRPILGDPVYTDPATDLAPWYDIDIPASKDFFGVYPLDVAGVDDFTGTTPVTEYLSDGGTPGRLRRSTKTVVVDAVLMGRNSAAVTYGKRWLDRALQGALCAPTADLSALGVPMTYVASEPVLPTYLLASDPGGGGPDPAFNSLARVLHNAKVTNGPVVSRKHKMSTCDGEIWLIQFTINVGNPAEFTLPVTILNGYMDPSTTDPWAPGITGGTADTAWATVSNVECGEDAWTPLFDPECSALIVPPPPPSIPLGCFTAPSSWSRRVVRLPASTIPLWGSVVPVLSIATVEEVRNLRIRFYPDPDGDFDPVAEPCGFSSDWIVSYLPAGGSMTLDAVTQTVKVTTSLGHTRRADSLVFRQDSKPIDWPDLSCGFGWVMTIDKPTTETTPVIDLSFVSKAD